MRLSFEQVLVDKAGKRKKKYYFFGQLEESDVVQRQWRRLGNMLKEGNE